MTFLKGGRGLTTLEREVRALMKARRNLCTCVKKPVVRESIPAWGSKDSHSGCGRKSESSGGR